MKIPDKAMKVMNLLEDAGAREVLIVGGFVRDSIFGVESKDVDIEVYGLPFDHIEVVLRQVGGFKVDVVGKAFGVLKIDNEIDISVPRRENKIGIGHKGFNVECDPHMTINEAASRRDFTINSMAMYSDGKIIDPFNGTKDIHHRILRATSEAFSEDPLRVLRGMQFAARFELLFEHKTANLAIAMRSHQHELPKERIWEEWKKWALQGNKPSFGLQALRVAHWDDMEIKRLIATPQDPEWHPEGDVWEHTSHVVDEAANIAVREHLDDHDRLVLMFAALTHDFGKPDTTVMENGRWRSKGHCQAGVKHAEKFLNRIGAPNAVIAGVKPLIAEHLVHAGIDVPTERAVRRLAKRLSPSSINMLSMLVEADHNGRPPLPKSNPLKTWVVMANHLNVSSKVPEPILMGRHLVDIGIEPGKPMGILLEKAFQAQLDGEFSNVDDALEWAHRN